MDNALCANVQHLLAWLAGCMRTGVSCDSVSNDGASRLTPSAERHMHQANESLLPSSPGEMVVPDGRVVSADRMAFIATHRMAMHDWSITSALCCQLII